MVQTINARRSFIFDPSLVLYLPLWKKDGNQFISDDAYGHLCSVTGATWESQGRTFDNLDDYINVGNTSILNFTSGDFSIFALIKPTSLDASNVILNRGLDTTDGYMFSIASNGRIDFTTNQAAAEQLTRGAISGVAVDTKYSVGVSRAGAVAKTYLNGIDNTDSSGTHIDPVTNTRNALIGIYDSLDFRQWGGIIGAVIVYSRALSSAEFLHLDQGYRWWR